LSLKEIDLLPWSIMRYRRSLAIVLAAVIAGGALWYFAQSSPPVYVTYSGRVVDLNGSPVRSVKLEFCPYPFSDVKDYQIIPCAVTDEEGRFVADSGNLQGIVARRYKVTINALLPAEKAKVPEAYRDPTTTPLEIRVSRRGDDTVVIQIP
jgi:hypothetical protein